MYKTKFEESISPEIKTITSFFQNTKPNTKYEIWMDSIISSQNLTLWNCILKNWKSFLTGKSFTSLNFVNSSGKLYLNLFSGNYKVSATEGQMNILFQDIRYTIFKK